MKSPNEELQLAAHESGPDAGDGSSTGTEVPWMWMLLRPPRLGGGAKHASGQKRATWNSKRPKSREERDETIIIRSL
jgi:hypothetical protein